RRRPAAGSEEQPPCATRGAAPGGDLARDARPERDEYEVVAGAEPNREQAGRGATPWGSTHACIDGERERDGIGNREHGRTSISKWASAAEKAAAGDGVVRNHRWRLGS